jgi:membrane-associated phospholipid phosphatase
MTTFPELTSLVPLDYTYVVCESEMLNLINLGPCTEKLAIRTTLDDPTDLISAPLALLTLSPFFLFSAYATLIIINRPLSVVNLFIGQLANEGLNKVLKRTLKAGRPWVLGDGYGMPSSHSQVSSGLVSPFLVVIYCIVFVLGCLYHVLFFL